jgi:hypothetical protein
MAVLYLSVPTLEKVPAHLREELEKVQRERKLTVRVAVTREDVTVDFDKETGRCGSRAFLTKF